MIAAIPKTYQLLKLGEMERKVVATDISDRTTSRTKIKLWFAELDFELIEILLSFYFIR